MLTIDKDLPPSILIGQEVRALQSSIANMGGVWFHADPDHVLINDDVVTGWRAQGDGPEVIAVPTAPNDKNTQFDTSLSAFVFRSSLHCGLTLPNVVSAIRKFTVAIVFASPDEPARSLFSLNVGANNCMIFLSEAEGEIFAQDKSGAVRVASPVVGRSLAKQLAILSYDQGQLSLWTGAGLVRHSGRPQGLDAPADLFIGCRSNRYGLAKTLGSSRIYDVMFWSDHALLDERNPADKSALSFIHRYHRWTA